MTEAEQTQANAQKWCLERGITPNRDAAMFAAAKLTWAQSVRNGAVVTKAAEELDKLAVALGWNL